MIKSNVRVSMSAYLCAILPAFRSQILALLSLSEPPAIVRPNCEPLIRYSSTVE